MSPNIGTAVATPRVMRLPDGATDDSGAALEFLKWTLYSSVYFDNAAALPREVEAFNFLRGQPVPGAPAGVIANRYHTNMQAIRTLPRPNVFVLEDVRVVIPQIDWTSGSPAIDDDTVVAASENLDFVDDVVLLSQSLSMKFAIGDKNYIEAPLWMMPANVGIGGVLATATAGAAAIAGQRRYAMNTAGRSWSFSRSRPPILKNAQPFTCQLQASWTTNPTLNDDRLLFVLLGGLLGRGVQ